MPVKKFRSIEEMSQASHDLWCEHPDAAYFERLRKLWKRSSRISPRAFPPGVHKYRTIEDAQADRERWLVEHVRGLWRRRLSKGEFRPVQSTPQPSD